MTSTTMFVKNTTLITAIKHTTTGPANSIYTQTNSVLIYQSLWIMSDSDVEITAYEPSRKRHCATDAQQPSSSTTSTIPSVTWCDELPNVAGLPSIPMNCPTEPSTSETPSTPASPDTSGESTSTSYPSSPIGISTNALRLKSSGLLR